MAPAIITAAKNVIGPVGSLMSVFVPAMIEATMLVLWPCINQLGGLIHFVSQKLSPWVKQELQQLDLLSNPL